MSRSPRAPLALALCLTGACAPDAVRAAAPRPNVLLVSLDTLRPDHLGVYGYGRGTSPALDAFAQRFTVFDNAHTVAPWTAPSLITLMTSLHPDAHGVTGNPDPGQLSDEVVTLAEFLKGLGYRTGAFTEGGYAQAGFGLGQGFDEYPENLGDRLSFTSNRRYPSRLSGNVDRCLGWMGEPSDAPFFCFFQTYEPHSPYQAPLEFVRRYRPDYDEEAEHARLAHAVHLWNAERTVSDADLELLQRHLLHCDLRGLPTVDDPAGLRDESRRRGASLFHRDVGSTPALIDWYTDLYDAEIAYADLELDRLWRFLDETGAGRETIVIVVSDHGEGLGEHGEIGHGRALFEELTRIVCMASVPGLEQVARSASPVSLVDVMPTVLELLGQQPTGLDLQGQSFAALLTGADGDPDRPLFSHATLKLDKPQHSVRQGDWRLIVDDRTGETQLYDLRADPLEATDLSALHPDRVQRLTKLLRAREGIDLALRAVLAPGDRTSGLSPGTLEELEALGYVGDH